MVLAHHEIVARLESLRVTISKLNPHTGELTNISLCIKDLINEIRGDI